jgi:hypothetical protein
VGELELYMFMGILLLMQNRRGYPSKIVPSHLAFVSHPLKPLEDGVVAHWFCRISIAWKQPVAMPRQSTQYI